MIPAHQPNANNKDNEQLNDLYCWQIKIYNQITLNLIVTCYIKVSEDVVNAKDLIEAG